jgi:hypothetical protein
MKTKDGRDSVLLRDHLIGRSPDCCLQLDHPSVSGRHASVRWNGDVWELQDLGSTNGTYLDGVRVEIGSRPQLKEGSVLSFGVDSTEWVLVDACSPGPVAVALEGNHVIHEQGGLLALPSPDDPQVSIYRDRDGYWVAEETSGIRRLSNSGVIVAGGMSWRFDAGGAVVATVGSYEGVPTPSNIRLEFMVSLNEEQVDITVVHEAKRVSLKPRVHHYLLLTLARQRIIDQANPSLPDSSHGWIDRDRLLKMLKTTANQLAINVYRARRQFADSGLVDAVQIVEWRATSRELRVGVSNLSVATV